MMPDGGASCASATCRCRTVGKANEKATATSEAQNVAKM